MHYEWRTSQLYPDDLSDAETLKDAARWEWWPLIVNEGACVTVRREDAIRFGGFDEHPSYSGYLCGPYDLAWRLVNAGWTEHWHDSSVALWHFAHPDPIGTNGQKASLRQLVEKSYPHLQGHALTAVEAFSTGRFQPLQENPDIWKMRMSDRRIGSLLETRYASLTGQHGFSSWFIRKLWISLFVEIFAQYSRDRIWMPVRSVLRSVLRQCPLCLKLRNYYREHMAAYLIWHAVRAEEPVILGVYKRHNLVKLRDRYYAVHQRLELDLTTVEGSRHPESLNSNSYFSLLEMVRQSALARPAKP
jgi:hypothetical protein